MFVSGTGTRTFLHELAQQFTSLTKNDLELRFHAGAYFGTRTDATDLLLKRVKWAAAQAELQDTLLWFWTEAARDTGKETGADCIGWLCRTDGTCITCAQSF